MLMKKIRVFFTVMVLLAISVAAAAQNITVKGTVKDSAGEGIVGANVILKGNRTVYTMTDIDGAFTLSVPANGVLEVLCMGYQGQDVQVGNRTSIEIVLLEDNQLLDETIVVAYGTATKSSFTGSATVVNAESIEKKISTNVTSALAGTTPGVQVISSSGDPTSNGATIRIRGFGSMSASNAPLYVVDGVPYDGSISDINPQDVESMSVLKDAAASAIYGHRGANGVIIITTKKGKSGDAQVRFDARVGVNTRLIPQYDVISDPALYYETYYRQLYNSYFYAGHNAGQSYAYADEHFYNEKDGGLGYQIYTLPEGEKLIGTNFKINPKAKLGYWDGKYYYQPDDWYNEAYHKGIRQEYNASVSGASDRFNYFASVGYLNDGGVVDNSKYQRYTGRINADYQAKPWLRLTTTMSYSHSDSQVASYSTGFGSSGNIFYIVNNMGPIYPLYVRTMDVDDEGNPVGDPYIVKEDGRILYDSNNTNQKRPFAVGNAVRDNAYDSVQQYADVLVGKWGVVLTPFEGMTVTANIGITNDQTRYKSLSSVFASASSTDGYAYVSASRFMSVNNQYLANYHTDFGGSEHHLEALAGFERYSYITQGLSAENDHLFNPLVGELDNAKGTSGKDLSSSTSSYLTQGFLGRLQYDYAGRYFFSTSVRRDASSRFAPGHRWGTFWSVGGAWLMSQEPWFNVPAVNMLKLKLSYGSQGNDNLGSRFPYSDQYSTSYNEETGQYSIKLSYKGNEDLTWETSKNFNGGVDFELFNGYLNGSIEGFSRITKDLLYSKDVPLSSGNPTGYVPVNVGSISNTGVEITLDGHIINNRNFNWSWNLNASHYKNKILELDESVSKEGIKGSNFIYKVGGSLYEAYMYRYAGVDPQTGKALYYTEQEDEDGNVKTITTDSFSSAVSKYEVGSVLPKLYGGFGTSLNFYGVDFSCQFSYQLGGKYYDGTYQALMHTQSSAGQAWHKDILRAWTKPGDVTDIPRLDGDTTVGQSAVDRFLVSSNYLSINNITLGYTLPAKLTKRVGIQSLRLYVTGENLYVFSARKGIDPRFSVGLGSYTSGSGLNSGNYSSMRNITGGISLTF